MTADVGELLELVDPADARRSVDLAPNEGRTLIYRARPVGRAGASRVAFTARAEGLRDAFTRDLDVAFAGFPHWSRCLLIFDTHPERGPKVDLGCTPGDPLDMEPIADRKIHFAPTARQLREIEQLVRDGGARNVTDLMRRALDCYLAARGRPPLHEQAREMAEDFAASRARPSADAFDLQDASRHSDESW